MLEDGILYYLLVAQIEMSFDLTTLKALCIMTSFHPPLLQIRGFFSSTKNTQLHDNELMA